jgi:hypothetical protein
MGAPFCLCVNVAIFGRITEVTRHLRPAYGILMA